jgi:hypothetical protein
MSGFVVHQLAAGALGALYKLRCTSIAGAMPVVVICIYFNMLSGNNGNTGATWQNQSAAFVHITGAEHQ